MYCASNSQPTQGQSGASSMTPSLSALTFFSQAAVLTVTLTAGPKSRLGFWLGVPAVLNLLGLHLLQVALGETEGVEDACAPRVLARLEGIVSLGLITI